MRPQRQRHRNRRVSFVPGVEHDITIDIANRMQVSTLVSYLVDLDNDITVVGGPGHGAECVDVDADIHAAVSIAPADSPKTATSISPPCTGCACPVDDDIDIAAGGHDMQLLCHGIDGFYSAGGGRQGEVHRTNTS
jgi:hypothetical protein